MSNVHRSKTAGFRTLVSTLAAMVLLVGAGVAVAQTSGAAPGDPITATQMPDPGLRDAVNAALGQSPGDTFTEAQAAGLTSLNADNHGIGDLTGIEYLTAIQVLTLRDNPIDDAAATYLAAHAADLPALRALVASRTQIGDTGAVAIAQNLTGLRTLDLYVTDVGDTGAVAIADNLGALTNLNLGDTDVTDTGVLAIAANLTGLERLDLRSGDVTDTGAVAIAQNLTALEVIELDDTAVSTVGAIAIADNLTNLRDLWLNDTDVGDAGVTAIAQNLTGLATLAVDGTGVGNAGVAAIGSGLGDLKSLWLARNAITDVSPLAGLSSLTYLNLGNQAVAAPPMTIGDATVNPVIDLDGNPVTLTSTDPDFSYDPGSNTWTFSSTGPKTMDWSTTVNVGDTGDVTFSGKLEVDVDATPPRPVAPEAPTVTGASCDAEGGVIDPVVGLPTTPGINYTLEGDVTAGGTVTVTATPEDGHDLDLTDAEGWTEGPDGTATLQVALEAVDCTPDATDPDDELPGDETPPTDAPGTNPTGDDAGSPPTGTVPAGTQPSTGTVAGTPAGTQLPATGPVAPLVPLTGVAVLLTLAGVALVLARRRITTH